MANELRLKRRLAGNAGAPAALKTAEPAMNFVDDVLYIGKGDDGGGNATSVVPIGGPGAFMALTGDQTIGGKKTFSTVPASSQDAASANDLVRKSQMDALLNSTALTGVPTAPTAAPGTNTTQLATTAFVQAAVTAGSVANLGAIGDVTIATPADNEVLAYDSVSGDWINQTPAEAGLAAAGHGHAISDVTGLQTALDAKAPLADPAFTGNPTAPTQTPGNNTTRLATTAFVQAALSALIDAAPGTMDTLNELAAALGDDPNFASTVTASLAGKLTAASNLSDVGDAAAARGNLGLASMAVQAANAVAITGGSIDGINFDGGTF